MSSYRPARVFAAINTCPAIRPAPQADNAYEKSNEREKNVSGNEIRVSATGQLSLPPDRCRFTVSICSTKETAQDAKNSVLRRFDYVLQVLNNHNVQEKDITTSKLLVRMGGVFSFDAEISPSFSDFNKCETIRNLLVEKLDDSVKISSPEYIQSICNLENIRKECSLVALKNAKQKASEMGTYMQCSVGKVKAILEEACNEWEGPADLPYDNSLPISTQQRLSMATIHVSTKVSVTFELKAKTRKMEKS